MSCSDDLIVTELEDFVTYWLHQKKIVELKHPADMFDMPEEFGKGS